MAGYDTEPNALKYEVYQITSEELHEISSLADLPAVEEVIRTVTSRKGLSPAQQRMKRDTEVRASEFYDRGPKEHITPGGNIVPPRELPPVYEYGTCPECGKQLYSMSNGNGSHSWRHDRSGSATRDDNMHIKAYSSVKAVTEEPKSIGQVLDETMFHGVPDSVNDSAITKLALDIIEQHPLTLSIKDWQVVQAMVEHGVRAGWSAAH